MSLEVKNLVKKYGNKVVVNNLSFKMEEPGVYALLGTNGAGKTTTIRIILGMLSYDEGEVLWDGKPMEALNVNLGYLAEERGLYPKYSLMDQLLYFASLKKIPKSVAKERIAYWAKRLEVEEYIYPEKTAVKGKKKPKDKTADQLSKGNQQKIQMMCALLSDPEFVVLDEPLSGLDPVNADLFKSIIRELIDNKKYVIMSSHQMATIEEFCKDITILNRGNIVLQGDLNEIKKSYGRVNMMIKCEEDIEGYINEMGLNVVNKTPDGYQIKVSGEAEAKKLLQKLVADNITIIRYELREPSLHEIFVEKVGDAHEEQ
ncbi:MAG: ATP-binding cassette domain-containing protein [Lachnospiraceae bacterium]|nr:ATP-binding cassette domain-containing protein [Lachnospiraceae bacterium]MDE6698999.1 ATP-binding cassette domain-containing protein [Lachnospiraceae bacterium]